MPHEALSGLVPDGPVLVDEEGNDVFDSINSPTSGEPIFDTVDIENSFGSNPVTRTLDSADQSLRNILSTFPGAQAGDPLLDVFDEAAENPENLRFDNPRNIRGVGIAVTLVVGLVVLWLVVRLLEAVGAIT